MHRFNIPGKLRTATGSITVPENSGLRFVLSLLPEDGEAASPTYKVLIKRWAKVREDARRAFVEQVQFKLGNILNTATSSDIWVIQGIAIGKDKKVDEKALKTVVKKAVDLAKYEKASIHVSQMTIDEAPELLSMLETQLLPEGLSLYVYPKE